MDAVFLPCPSFVREVMALATGFTNLCLNNISTGAKVFEVVCQRCACQVTETKGHTWWGDDWDCPCYIDMSLFMVVNPGRHSNLTKGLHPHGPGSTVPQETIQ